MARRKSKNFRRPVKSRRPGGSASVSAESSRGNQPLTPFELRNRDIEDALASDLHQDLLEDYFGEAQYAELRLLARQAMRASRGGPAVLILPGIMGSELGIPAPPQDDLIWVAYFQILKGRLSELILPAKPGPRLGALGVLLFAYEKLKLRLRAAGFDAEFYPYDWRQDIGDLGKGLAGALDKMPRPVSLVAHSMGGLVARAACAHRPKNLKRIVTLGAPNYGSYSPIQAFRGVHSVVNKVALLDLTNSAQDLARIFKTFPGLCEMIPSPDHADRDYFNLNSWPQSGVRPDQKMLSTARTAQKSLPHDCDGLVQIVGCNQETVVKARVEAGEFIYETSYEGDGTVPLAFARLPEPDTYYVEDEHGRLANNKVLASAVVDILNSGRTAILPKEPPAVRRIGTRSISETELRAAAERQQRARVLIGAGSDRKSGKGGSSPKATRTPPGSRELRNLVEEFASPAASDSSPERALGHDARMPSVAAPAKSDHVVVGRRSQHRLDITVAHGSLTEIDASAYVLGLFSQVSPSGPAAMIDAIMDGAVSHMMDRRMFSGSIGEITFLPKGRHPLRPDFIAFAGLGSFDTFSEDTLGLVAENLVRTFLASRVDDFATVAMGGGSGGLTLGALTHMLTGFIRGIVEADGDHNFRGITICEIDDERFSIIRDELYRLCATTLFDDVEVTLRERRLPQTRLHPAQPGSIAAELRRPDPTYLIVRQESFGKHLQFSCSVLSSGYKATVLTDTTEQIPEQALEALLGRLPQQTNSLTEKELADIGEKIGALVLPDNVRKALRAAVPEHFVVIHDTAASRVPWDAVHIDDLPLAGGLGISHRCQVQDLSIAKWLHKRHVSDRPRVLLAIDPTRDLNGAREEGKRIEALFAGMPSTATLDVLKGSEVTRSELLRRFSSGEYDVLHYSGHSVFDPTRPENCGLLLENNEVVTGLDLAPLANLPSLVFFNSCESARIRGQRTRKAVGPAEHLRRGHSVAEALLRGGIANFVGTYWPVRDGAAMEFAAAFYGAILIGKSIGDAFIAARQAVKGRKDGQSADWADYALYGNHNFSLRH